MRRQTLTWLGCLWGPLGERRRRAKMATAGLAGSPKRDSGAQGRDVSVSDRGCFYCLDFVTSDLGIDDVPADQAGSHAE